jgi:hypothetical protein
VATAVLPTLQGRAAPGPAPNGSYRQISGSWSGASTQADPSVQAWDAKTLCHTCAHAVGFPIRASAYVFDKNQILLALSLTLVNITFMQGAKMKLYFCFNQGEYDEEANRSDCINHGYCVIGGWVWWKRFI